MTAIQNERLALDMPTLAFKSALQIDSVLHGRKPTKNYVAILANEMKATAGYLPSKEQIQKLSPTRIDAYRKAVHAAKRNSDDLLDMVQLADELNQLTDNLNTLEAASTESLESLLSFCTALHEELQKQRRQSFNAVKLRSTHRM